MTAAAVGWIMECYWKEYCIFKAVKSGDDVSVRFGNFVVDIVYSVEQ